MIKPEFFVIFHDLDTTLRLQGNHKKATKLLLMAVQNRGQNGNDQGSDSIDFWNLRCQ